MFKIESAAETVMPPKQDNVWPWKNMKVGDLVRIHEKELARKAPVSAHNYSKQKSNMKFVTKTIDGVLHVWRTE